MLNAGMMTSQLKEEGGGNEDGVNAARTDPWEALGFDEIMCECGLLCPDQQTPELPLPSRSLHHSAPARKPHGFRSVLRVCLGPCCVPSI